MKKLLFLLLFIPSILQAQYFEALPQPETKHPWRTIALYSSSIILNGIGDGLNDEGHKGWGHAANAFSIGFIVLSPLVLDYDKSKRWAYVLDYGFLRIAYFDWTYNTTRGLPLTYIGTTSTWDKYFMQKLKPPDGFAMGRLVSFSVGISIPFNLVGTNSEE